MPVVAATVSVVIDSTLTIHLEVTMPPSELSRMLTAEEVAELGPPPTSDIETPTTGLVKEGDSTASEHFAGIAPATESADDDVLPDPLPVKEN